MSDNISVRHVLNIKRIAYPLRPVPPGARPETAASLGTRSGAAGSPGIAADADLVERIVRRVLHELKE